MENNFQIDSASVSDRGLSEKRPQNEDSFLEMNQRGLFAVADGVGGAQAGDVASQMAVEILGEAFVNLKENGDAEEMMKLAIERANTAIYQMSHDLTQLSTMATTMVALHVSGNIATIGHVGDSRLYRLDSKGKLYRETQDHSVVEEEVRAGRMTAAQASNHPSRNVISRALGADYAVEVDMKTIMFEPHTTFLLCSDGITRHIDDFELRDLLISSDKPANIVQKMKDICYQRGAGDNLTAVIAKVTDTVAVNFSDKKPEPIFEYEEATVIAARPPVLTNNEEFAAPLAVEEEIPTRQLEMPATVNDKSAEETVASSEMVFPTTTQNRNSLSFEAGKAGESPFAVSEKVREDKPIFTVVEKKPDILGRVLTPLLTLFLGTLIGAGVYHSWARQNAEPDIVPVPTQQSQNIPLTSFEESRRTVDKNPQQYLASSTLPPESAEDFYLMGRANLLLGKFSDAKQMFLQAKDHLGQTSDVNNKVLANDIEVGLIIVTVPFAQNEFIKVMNLNNSNSSPNTNSFRTNPNINGR